jgi:hypothetical protein
MPLELARNAYSTSRNNSMADAQSYHVRLTLKGDRNTSPQDKQ